MDHRNSDDMPRCLHIDLDHQAAAMARSSVHLAVDLAVDNRSSNIMLADTVISTETSVAPDRSTAVGSVRKIVTEALSLVHTAAALVADTHSSDVMPADTVVSTVTSVDLDRSMAVGLDLKTVTEAHSSAHIGVVSVTVNQSSDITPEDTVVSLDLLAAANDLVHETAIAARNLTLAT